MINLYVATRALTFFGTVMRAIWEQIACRICGVPVEDVRAFKVSELCGHVEHDIIKKKSHVFAVCFIPFVMNFIFACCFLLSGAYRVIYVGDVKSVSAWVLLWLGISFAANCVPSFEDVLSFKDAFFDEDTKPVIKILVAPFYAIIYGFSFLERFSLTFIISVLFAVVFPQLFNLIFPLINFFVQK